MPSLFCANCGVGFVVQPKKSSVLLPVVLILLVTPCALCGILGTIGGALKKVDERPITSSNTAESFTSSSNLSNSSNQKTSSTVTAPTPKPKGLVLIKSTWQKGGFGTVALWRVTIKNESDKPLGDIKFRTAYYSETNDKVRSGGVDGLIGKDTIEKVVPAKGQRQFEVNDGFVSDEANTGDFKILSWREVP